MKKFLWKSPLTLLTIFSLSSALAFSSPVGREKIADGQVATWTDQRVAEWQPKASERRFDEIGWAKDLRTARQLAEKSQRPVFIFTMDGRINIGRC